MAVSQASGTAEGLAEAVMWLPILIIAPLLWRWLMAMILRAALLVMAKAWRARAATKKDRRVSESASATALGCCAFRAFGNACGICNDSFAWNFLDRLTRTYVSMGVLFFRLTRRWPPDVPDLPIHLARTLFFDRHVFDAIRKGGKSSIRQLVILAAGYDTRSYRALRVWETRAPLDASAGRQLRVWEVDAPSTQCSKVAALARCEGNFRSDHTNGRITHVPADFEDVDVCWLEALQRSGLVVTGGSASTVLTLEGILHYLQPKTVDRLLQRIATLKGATVLIHINDHALRPAGSEEAQRRLLQVGEVQLFGVKKGGYEQWLRPYGIVIDGSIVGDREMHQFLTASDDEKLKPISTWTQGITHAYLKCRVVGVVGGSGALCERELLNG